MDHLGEPGLHDECHAADTASESVRGAEVSRRTALQLAAGAGALAVATPALTRLGSGPELFGLETARLARTAIPDWPAPAIVTRARWGANESLRKPGQTYNQTISKVIVHHTGTPNDITDYPGLARSIFTYELRNGYIDIAYNWLIDPNGRIYEGRWAEDYPAGAVHTGELNGENVQGAHALHYNVDTIGIGLMGDYSTVTPNPAMIDALVELMTWKCARWGLDPLGAGGYVNSLGAQTHISNICGHRDTYATECPGDRVEAMLPHLRTRVAAQLVEGGTGYWIASQTGQLVALGSLPNAGGIGGPLSGAIIALAAHPTARGYWLLGSDGGVFAFGDAGFHGSTGGRRLNQPMVGMAATRSGNGYWLVARDGGVFCFGDAKFFGSTGAMHLNAPVLGLTPTPTGNGYWIYARDGGIFCFGDAKFFGSTGALRLNAPIVGMACRPKNDGYWMVASDGGVFTFGRARFFGSTGGQRLSAPCVSITSSTTGRGYALCMADGSVYAFGDAPFLGSAAGRLSAAAVGLAGRLKPIG